MIVNKIDTKPFKKALGMELWQLRQQNNLTLNDLKIRTGFPEKLIERVELGRRVPIYLIIKLIELYRKKIKIELVD